MLAENHVEKVRFEVSFPEADHHEASATVYMHISVVHFFKTLTYAQIENIRKDLILEGEQYFGAQAKLECRVMIDAEHGLRSWDCPGYACDFGPHDGEWDHMKSEDREWIKYTPHNIDRPEQLVYLLAAACYFRDLAEAADE